MATATATVPETDACAEAVIALNLLLAKGWSITLWRSPTGKVQGDALLGVIDRSEVKIVGESAADVLPKLARACGLGVRAER